MALKQLHLFFNKSYARKKLKKMFNSTIFKELILLPRSNGLHFLHSD